MPTDPLLSSIRLQDAIPHSSNDAFVRHADFILRSRAFVSSLNDQYPKYKPAFLVDPSGDGPEILVTFPAALPRDLKTVSQWENVAATFGLSLH